MFLLSTNFSMKSRLLNRLLSYLVSQVYWFKDGKQISKRSEHYRISRDADGTCSLHTVAASLDDDGNYTIMAGNPEVSRKTQEKIL